MLKNTAMMASYTYDNLNRLATAVATGSVTYQGTILTVPNWCLQNSGFSR